MNIAIIGCGYVGTEMAHVWKQSGHVLTATTRTGSRRESLQAIVDHVIVLEPNYQKGLERALENQDVVLVAVAPDGTHSYKQTYLYTAKVLAEVLKNNSSVKQVIYLGSTSVYGDHGGAWVDENTITVAQHDNTSILIETESTYLGMATESRKVCILRLAEIYGPGREFEDKLRTINGRPLPGDGSSYTNIIHRSNICRVIDFVMQKGLSGIFNLCEDFHIPRRELYERICYLRHLSPVNWDPSLKSSHGGNRRVSNLKIKALGFVFQEIESVRK